MMPSSLFRSNVHSLDEVRQSLMSLDRMGFLIFRNTPSSFSSPGDILQVNENSSSLEFVTPGFLTADGSTPLTSHWDAGPWSIQADSIEVNSLQVQGTSLVQNLNADLLDGLHASDFILVEEGDGFLLRSPSGSFRYVKSRLDAEEAPGTDDDSSLGYSPGSLWVDLENDKSYICLDAAEQNAVWTEITQSGGGGSLTDHDHTAAGDGGVLTNDMHDGYMEMSQISTPSNPPENSLRLFSRENTSLGPGWIDLVARSHAGEECTICLALLDHVHVNELQLNLIE